MNGDDPTIVLAATPRQWAASLHAHAVDHGGVVVRATVLTAADARAEGCDVLVVDDITSFLTPALVADARAAGRAVLGVFDPDDPHGKGDLVDAGVDALVGADTDPADLVATIRGLAATIRGLAATIPAGTPRGPVPNVRGTVDGAPATAAPRSRPTSHRLVGVAGPTGGTGITEVAIELAAVMGTTGHPTLLVDADELGSSHAQRLGLALQPNLLGAVDAHRRGADLTLGLHHLSRRHPLRALPGMAAGQDWSSLPTGALEDLTTALGAHCSRVVVDLGHCPEAAVSGAGMRFGHAAALAPRCTDLVLVACASPVAIGRTLEIYSRVRADGQAVHAVLNRVGRDRFVVEESVAELRRGLGVDRVHVLSEDPVVARAAWDGERVPRGKFLKQVAAMTVRSGLLG